ncbi:hypothetical protein FIBSPDRAFT_898136 [Athelia psychrophila]|uniref:C2 domain-containing protein n=1 Tax=Athelia psychrophila TaxID=1759441 RepID=A0A166BC92_9AGAM|nr:hypothetical protein FIBSPDRAFT_898136 [Fibularhizoctonia sp. CBS 109695]
MSQITTRISASSIDVRALGDSPEPSKTQKLTHMFVLNIDGSKVLESAKVPRESLEWKELEKFHFTPSSTIEIAIYRKSRALGWRKPVLVGEYTGRGMDFIDATQELVEKSGDSRLAIKFDLVAESHEAFMKAVDEEMRQLAKVKGAGAQTATSLVATIGTALEAIVPVLDKLTGAHPIVNGAWIVLSFAYKVRAPRESYSYYPV